MSLFLKNASLVVLSVIVIFLAGKHLASVFLRDYWPIELVSVEGVLNSGERRQIRDAVADHIHVGLLFVDLNDVVSSVMALSWPREVEVRRRWPNKLMLNVRKQSLVAHWNGSGYLSASGKIVFDPDLPDQDLPDFFAKHSDGIRAMEIFEGLNSVIQNTGLKIAEIREDSRGSWQVTFERGLEVMLGSDALSSRLGRFVRVYNESLQTRIDQIASVDARYGNGVAVKWLGSTLEDESLTIAANKVITGERR